MVQNGYGHTITSLAISYHTGLDNVRNSNQQGQAEGHDITVGEPDGQDGGDWTIEVIPKPFLS